MKKIKLFKTISLSPLFITPLIANSCSTGSKTHDFVVNPSKGGNTKESNLTPSKSGGTKESNLTPAQGKGTKESTLTPSHKKGGGGSTVDRPFGFFAPYQDMGLSATQADLGPIYKATGQNHFVLGFLNQRTANDPLTYAGNNWDGTFVKNKLNGVTNPDFVVSTGGAAGPFPWQLSTDGTKVGDNYYTALKAHNIHYFDYDIEGGGITGSNVAAQSAKEILNDAKKDNYKMAIMLTLATMPNGLTYESIKPLQAFIDAGVYPTVNMMTFDYGQYYSGAEGTYSVQALKAGFTQYKNLLTKASVTWTDTRIWGHMGATNMIGVNDTHNASHPNSNIFKLSDVTTVLNFAQQEKIGFLGFWEASRDHAGTGASPSTTSSGLNQGDYAFINAFKKFNQ